MTVPIKPPELMDGEFSEFIGVWKNFMPKFLCNQIIDYINHVLDQDNASHNIGDNSDRSVSDGSIQFDSRNLGRKDKSIMLNSHDHELSSQVNQYLHACFLHYINHYGQLINTPLISTDLKLQKTSEGGGYHVWHCENSGWHMAQRVLVWAIYLNDMPDGEAETEFLYQKRRIKPERGTCVIWPAGFTHQHRGNPVYTQDKYILTGWYLNAPIQR